MGSCGEEWMNAEVSSFATAADKNAAGFSLVMQ